MDGVLSPAQGNRVEFAPAALLAGASVYSVHVAGYVSGGGIAMRQVDTWGGDVVYYLVTDHLGTTSLVLDAAGGRVAESRHYPYGAVRWTWTADGSGTLPTDYRFTGQRDVGLGLTHMGARFLDTSLGRWTSADTIVPEPGNPQSLNRYSYVSNSPLKYVDPTGHKEEGECGFEDESCDKDLPPIDELIIETLQGMIDSIYDPTRVDPIVIPLDDGTVLVIMPIGSDPFEQRSLGLERGGEIIGTLGAVVDIFEMVGMVTGGGADLGATVDVLVAAGGSALTGDMWLGGRPHPDLPPMFLFGQDVIVAAGDLALPWMTGGVATGLTGQLEVGMGVKTGTDIVTTAVGGLYDLTRSQGHFPTIVNAGFSLEWPPHEFVFVYPGSN